VARFPAEAKGAGVKPRQAKLVSCVKEGDLWVATDSAGRRFIADTEAEAIRMCQQYNHR
jgi:hypothetical protein